METWVWLIAYVVGFALMQLYLYRYFIRGQTTESSPESTTPRFEGGASIEQVPSEQPDDDHVACSQCGGYNQNEPAFTYCKHCGERLG